MVTRGKQGSSIYVGSEELEIPCARPRQLGDPTGVGDAYRAGLLKGLVAGLDFPTCGRLGSLAACFVVEQVGTREHRFTPEEFLERYAQDYGDASAIAQVIGAAMAERG